MDRRQQITITPEELQRILKEHRHLPVLQLKSYTGLRGRVVGSVEYMNDYAEFVGTLYHVDLPSGGRPIYGRVTRDHKVDVVGLEEHDNVQAKIDVLDYVHKAVIDRGEGTE